MIYRCEKCGKALTTMPDYNKETKDVSNGWQWVVEHKEEYCTKQ